MWLSTLTYPLNHYYLHGRHSRSHSSLRRPGNEVKVDGRYIRDCLIHSGVLGRTMERLLTVRTRLYDPLHSAAVLAAGYVNETDRFLPRLAKIRLPMAVQRSAATVACLARDLLLYLPLDFRNHLGQYFCIWTFRCAAVHDLGAEHLIDCPMGQRYEKATEIESAGTEREEVQLAAAQLPCAFLATRQLSKKLVEDEVSGTSKCGGTNLALDSYFLRLHLHLHLHLQHRHHRCFLYRHLPPLQAAANGETILVAKLEAQAVVVRAQCSKSASSNA